MPVDDLDEAKPFHFVPPDEPAARKVAEEGIYIAVVIRQGLHLDPTGPVFKPSLPVGNHP